MGQVLVTGASGFTGSNLCRRLVRNGQPVVAFVRATSRTDELQRLGVECRVVDITSRAHVHTNFTGISTVYHLAAAYRVEHADRGEFRRVNVEATRNLLDAALVAGVRRFVHCSTVGVQGQIDDPPAAEDYRVRPGDHYQGTKLEGELLARGYLERGLPVTVIRPTGIYGPGDLRFLKLFRGIYRGRFAMIGSGERLYHLTYIEDVVDGLLLAGGRREAVGEVLTIAGPRYTTLNELVSLMSDVLRRPRPWLKIPFAPVYATAVVSDKLSRPLGVIPPLYPRRMDFFSKDRAFDISKARRLLGYEPTVELAEGICRTAEWYTAGGML